MPPKITAKIKEFIATRNVHLFVVELTVHTYMYKFIFSYLPVNAINAF